MRGEKHVRKETVRPAEDTINRRNRMKLRCVRGGERMRRRRAGGGESDRESDTSDANIPPDVPLHLQRHQMRNSLHGEEQRLRFFTRILEPKLTSEPAGRGARRGRGVGGVFETSHIGPGAERQQCSGRGCCPRLLFHILTHANTHRGPL